MQTRLKYRELEAKITPAIKVLSKHLHGTAANVPEEFEGYKIPAGTFTDRFGRTWQLQVSCTCSKSKFIKKNEIVPMIRKWAIGLRLRIIAKSISNWANS